MLYVTIVLPPGPCHRCDGVGRYSSLLLSYLAQGTFAHRCYAVGSAPCHWAHYLYMMHADVIEIIKIKINDPLDRLQLTLL